jgi:hypothetical protein
MPNQSNQVQRWRPSQAPAKKVIPIVEIAKVTESESVLVYCSGGTVAVAVVQEVSLEYLMLGLTI